MGIMRKFMVLMGWVLLVVSGFSLNAADGALWGWGNNQYGQLGVGINNVPKESLLTDVKQVSAGGYHILIVKTDGSLWAYGWNAYGQLGDGTTVDRLTPVQILSSGVFSVSAGLKYSLVIKTDGSLWSCGDNTSGQLGDGTKINRSNLVQIFSSGVKSASAGWSHTQIVKTDGSLWACGANSSGQLGDGTTFERMTPIQIYPSGVAMVSVGAGDSRIIKTDSSLWACGQNGSGQLGDGTTITRLTPVQIYSSGIQSVSAGNFSSLMLKTDGSVWACGWNQYGQLGDGTFTDNSSPVEIFSSGIQDIVTGYEHSLILKTDGSVWACGRNQYGQLGDGTTSNRNTLIQIFSSGVKSMSCGNGYTLVLKSDGTLWTCGLNNGGQLCYAMTEWRPPEQVMPSAIQSVVASSNHMLFIKADCSLWGCGSNINGQLGDGATTERPTPVQILSSGVQSVSTGSGNTFFIKTDGSLWGCGVNNIGQLGDGTTTSRITPVQIISSGVQSISNSGHTLIVKTDGSLWGCGSNINGQLGDGTTTDRINPVQIFSGGVKTVSAGGMHTAVLKTDGSLWTCGDNASGQLGDGTTTSRTMFVEIFSSGVHSASAGMYHTLIVKTDGSLWACGWNYYGELGDGTTTQRNTPVQIFSSGVQSAVAGKQHSLILKTDGSLWACGLNNSGQLGDGTTTNRTSPVQILSSGVQNISAGDSHSLIIYNPSLPVYNLSFTAGPGGKIGGYNPQKIPSTYKGVSYPAVGFANTGSFVKWTKDGADYSTDNPLSISNISSNMTLTAVFGTPSSYTVVFNAGAGGSISGTLSQSITPGVSCTAVEAKPFAGYKFTKWTKDGSDYSATNPLTVTNVTSNMTLTAVFEQLTYSVTFTATTGGTISGTSPQTVTHGGSCSAIEAKPSTGYKFVKWTKDNTDYSTSNPLTVTNITSNMTITAVFEQLKYTVTYTVGTGGTISGNTPQSVAHGGSCTAVEAKPSTGYKFVKWTKDGGDYSISNPLTVTNVTSALSFTAVFEQLKYTVNFTASSGGSISGSSPQTVVYGGSCSEVKAVPQAGYKFTKWTSGTTDYSTSNLLTVTNVTSDLSLTANFEAATTYTVSASPSPSAGGSVTVSASTVNPGQTVDLSATPGSGYYFTGWTASPSGNAKIADSTSSTTTAVISGSVSFSGYFSTTEAKTASLTLSVDPTEGGTTEPAVATVTTVNQGIPYTIVAIPATGYYFAKWTADKTSAKFGSSGSSSTTVTVSEDTVVMASFTTTPTETFVLTVAASPEEGGTTVPESGSETSVTSGETVTITATAADGYVFAGWKADTSENVTFGNASESETTATVIGTVTVTAYFTQGSGTAVGTVSLSSGYKEMLRKTDGELVVSYRNRAGFSAKMKVDLSEITEETQVDIFAGFYSFSGVIGNATVKKITDKGGLAKFINTDIGETVIIQWRNGSALVSVKLAPPIDDDTNMLDLYDEVYGEAKATLSGDISVWVSVGDRIFSNSIPYTGTGASKYNKSLDDDLVGWSVKGKGTMEEMTFDTGTGTDTGTMVK